MELIGTHLCLTIGSWRVRVSFAIEDADLQAPVAAARPSRELRALSDEKLDGIFRNRR